MQKIKTKKALSNIITTIIMISLVLVAAVLIYGAINNIIESKKLQLAPGTNCLDISLKQQIKIQKVCYNSNSKELEITLSRERVQLKIEDLTFIVQYEEDASSWCCGKECEECEILEERIQTYYLSSEKKPKQVNLIVQNCDIKESEKVTDC